MAFFNHENCIFSSGIGLFILINGLLILRNCLFILRNGLFILINGLFSSGNGLFSSGKMVFFHQEMAFFHQGSNLSHQAIVIFTRRPRVAIVGCARGKFPPRSNTCGDRWLRARKVAPAPQYAWRSLAARAESSPRAAIRVAIVGCARGRFSPRRNTRGDRWLRARNILPRVVIHYVLNLLVGFPINEIATNHNQPNQGSVVRTGGIHHPVMPRPK